MKLSKLYPVLLVAIFAMVFSLSVAFAEDNEQGERIEARAVTTQATGVSATQTLYKSREKDNKKQVGENESENDSRKVEKKNQENEGEGLNASSTDRVDNQDEDRNEDSGDRHARLMKGFEKNIDKLSREIPGLGDEIRAIATNEASSTEERVQAIHEIQRQSFLARLFFGTDKSKIKDLSEKIKGTQKSIDRLTVVKTKVASSTLQTKIDEQIKILESAQTSAEKFVNDNQSAFSIFGFLSKIFGGK